MNLREFVSETLEQLIGAIKDARDNVGDSDGAVVPTFTTSGGIEVPRLQEIDFDVAVTVVDEKTRKKGAGIVIAGFGVGASGDEGTRNTTVSRIQFKVPVILPHTLSPKHRQCC